ncbi:phage portal protein, partial [Candidatus Pacearchaeota archaeon]|nr:phage portal protein [Candidatus Pacearchaeota archaeon]
MQAWSESYNRLSNFTGDKFYRGFGLTEIQLIDYWTLRQRSAQLFNKNLYARGLIRRLVTNEINTGLILEAMPNENILEISEDVLSDWADKVEDRFGLWGENPRMCDYLRADTFSEIQKKARQEALVTGDVLIVSRQSQQTKLPTIELVGGHHVRTPLNQRNLRSGHKIIEGVELDKQNRQVAYYVTQNDGTSKRIPAFGDKSGRRIAWLLYGTDKRLGEVRGQPLLALILQSINEIDKYRDATQLKATMNAFLVMFIKRSGKGIGSRPLTEGGAIRKDSVTTTDESGNQKVFEISKQLPGLALQDLAPDEEPVGFHNQGVDEKFGDFEKAIIQGIAWANEIPPEILCLAFSNNYSASQAAISEFKMYLNSFRAGFGKSFCQPIYVEWLLSEVLLGRINAAGLIEAWRNMGQQYDIFGAWTFADFTGAIKPSTDMKKQGEATVILRDNGWTTNARASRELTGTKFRRNIKKLKKENKMRAEAMRP